jgi:POT family proton-dependent oligopeptide transporter
VPETAAARFPPQIRYIIGNEAAERFSFYGMRNILTVFLIDYLLRTHPSAKAQAQSVFHDFVGGVYFFPLLGGWLSDRFLGKYRTILWVSILYCFGHLCLALFDSNLTGFYIGLFLIALGSGGIKPCVSAFVGDQFTEANRALIPRVFGWFYWSINFGSFFASLTIPALLQRFGPKVAFGVPGLLMLLATVIFVAGRRLYVNVPPSRPPPHGFLAVMRSAFAGLFTGRGFWAAARSRHPAASVEGCQAVLRVITIFIPVIFFWACFDQKASLWVIQGRSMAAPQIGGWTMLPAQMQSVNPALVMLLVPLTTYGLYPWLERRGLRFTPLRRMGIGLMLTGVSYLLAAAIQLSIDGGGRPSLLWQLGPYAVLTLSEIFVSVTGLEFAYTQAPKEMKGVIMSFWLLTTSIGNFFVSGLVKHLDVFTGTARFVFWAVLVFAAAGLFALIARGYVTKDHLLTEAEAARDRGLAAPGVAAADAV